jgi:hypothetical protein
LKFTVLIVPPICEWIVTVEIAVTWPNGGGSIRTGTFVATDLATSTGAPGACLFAAREQPASVITSNVETKMKWRMEIFILQN